MSTQFEIITKYSDYEIHSIEYFITQLENEIEYRDIKGLSNGRIDLVNISKEHPLVTLMDAQLNSERNSDDLRSNILPAISVTPGNMTDGGFTLAKGLQSEIVDDDFIAILDSFADKTNKEKQEDLLITNSQIESIKEKYNRVPAGAMRVQINEWHKNEEINISVWSESPDTDILFSNLTDSLLAAIAIGFAGDNSRIRSFKYDIVRGLTNFNHGRVIFGSEYNLTFINTYRNFMIYTDPVITDVEFNGTFTTPGEET